MRRTTGDETPTRLPDVISLSSADNFTQIPNGMLRNPELSAKAKGILCLLLSNRDGWYSYIDAIQSMMKDGKESIYSGLKELEQNQYLIRIRYRNKKTKQICGMIWGYTDVAGEFDMGKIEELCDQNQLEAITGFPRPGFATSGKPTANNTKDKNTKGKNRKKSAMNINGETDSSNEEEGRILPIEIEKRITQSMFERFWLLYPRKVDKGRAKTKWDKMCAKPAKERPTWKQIKSAILAQKKSERWQDPQFIPHPTTWLNQQRWLDDPAEMRSFEKPAAPQCPIVSIKKKFGALAGAFERECLSFAEDVFPKFPKEKLTAPLAQLYDDIVMAQSKHSGNLPSPMTIIHEYIQWIDDSDWINADSIRLLSMSHQLFGRFVQDYSRREGNNPLTGESFLRE